jgi:phosphohistidine phosphatase SixA
VAQTNIQLIICLIMPQKNALVKIFSLTDTQKHNGWLPLLFFAATLPLLLKSCQNMDNANNYLKAVKDGQLHFADGSTKSIPHWGEAGWAHFFCVRHAEKAKDSPVDPLLTADGAARAERLGRILAEARLDSVYVSAFKRAQLTAEPVVRRGQTPPAVIYSPNEQAEWLEALLPSLAGKRVLVVGHVDSVPALLNQLNGGGFDFDNIPSHDYGRLYIAATKGLGQTEFLELRY